LVDYALARILDDIRDREWVTGEVDKRLKRKGPQDHEFWAMYTTIHERVAGCGFVKERAEPLISSLRTIKPPDKNGHPRPVNGLTVGSLSHPIATVSQTQRLKACRYFRNLRQSTLIFWSQLIEAIITVVVVQWG